MSDFDGRIAEAIAKGADLERIPDPIAVPAPKNDFDSLNKSVRALKSAVDKMTGMAGDITDKTLTIKDLIDAGVVAYSPAYGISTSAPTFVSTPGGGVTPPDGGYVDPRPILPVPPTPVSLTASGTFRSVVLTWGLLDYQNHAYTEIWRNTTDNLGSAANIGTSDGNQFVDSTVTPSVLYYYWVRAVNIEGAVGAFNSVSGTSAGAQIIENIDLGPLIVEAANLASGAVTAAKMAAGVVDLTKFAAGIEPLTIVTGALPTVLGTKAILWTADNKIYRWNGSAYIKSVDGADISATSIQAGSIAAGAIGTDQLAANAVRTGNLLVTGQGAALNPDPNTRDLSAWDYGAFTLVTDSTSPTGYALRVSTRSDVLSSPPTPLDEAKNYQLRASFKQESGTSTTYLTVVFYDGSGNILTGTLNPTGWPGVGTFHYYGLVGQTGASVWTEYRISFGPNETAKIPVGAKSVRVGALYNYSGTGVQRLANIRLTEKANADLIVDGSIMATKLSANAIAVGTAAIQNGAIRNLMIDRGTADKLAIVDADIVNLNATKIDTGYLHSDRIQAGTISALKMEAGLFQGDNVLTRGLTVRDYLGNIILGSGSNLDWSRVGGTKPVQFRATSIGYGAAAPNAAGVANLDTSENYSPGMYWATVTWINRFTGAYINSSSFNLYSGGTAAADAMAAQLSALTDNHVVVITTYDQAGDYSLRTYGSLPSEIYRCGGSKGIWGSSEYAWNFGYILIGIPGCKEGGGFEFASDPVNIPSYAETTFTIQNGVVNVGARSSQVRLTAANISTYIAAAAIDYARIGSVDAGTISVGILNADRIAAQSIKTTHIQIGDVVGSTAFSYAFPSATLSSGATTYTAYPMTYTSFTSTGRPGLAIVRCVVGLNFVVSTVKFIYCRFKLYRSGIAWDSGEYWCQHPTMPSGSGAKALFTADIISNMSSVPSGTDSWAGWLYLEFRDSAGNLVSCGTGSTITAPSNFSIVEYKV